MTPRVVVLMGVAGSGKTTVGRALAHAQGWRFRDADGLHPPANISKMKRGEPLTDADRKPWIAAVRRCVVDFHGPTGPAVLACSALKEDYRRTIVGTDRDTIVVYLRGSRDLIAQRLEARRQHFMPAGLLQSQFDDLEEPDDVITVDIDQCVAAILDEIATRAGLARWVDQPR